MKRIIKIVAPLFVGALVAAPFVFAADTPISEVDTAPGETAFNTYCMACHQATGSGVPGAFPPLAGHVPELLNTEGGAQYLMNVVTFGLTGPITVAGADYNGAMPAHGPMLSDEELASVLNYISTAWGNVDALNEGTLAFTADGVAAERAADRTSGQVHALREALDL